MTDPAVAPSPPNKNKTLLVLLVVAGGGFLLCICSGIVAAVAIPAFINYVKRSKVAEASTNVAVLARAVERRCEETGAYPGAVGPVPEAPTSGSQVVDFGAVPGFVEIGFDPGSPVYFAYAIEPAGSGVDVVAYGDLDGDGRRSEHRIHCGAACACGPVQVVDPLE